MSSRDAGAREADARGDMDASAAEDGAAARDAEAGDADLARSACEQELSDAEFCDGFEDDELAAWPDSYGDGSVQQTTDRAHRGTGALAASAQSDELAAVAVEGLEPLAQELYIRGYVYIPASLAVDDIGMMHVSTSEEGVAIGVEEGGFPYVFVDAEGRGVRTSAATVPRDTWTCLRAHIEIASEDGAVDLWIEDELVASETGLNTVGGDAYTAFAAGITSPNHDGDAPTLYLDDVATGATPLPCD